MNIQALLAVPALIDLPEMEGPRHLVTYAMTIRARFLDQKEFEDQRLESSPHFRAMTPEHQDRFAEKVRAFFARTQALDWSHSKTFSMDQIYSGFFAEVRGEDRRALEQGPPFCNLTHAEQAAEFQKQHDAYIDFVAAVTTLRSSVSRARALHNDLLRNSVFGCQDIDYALWELEKQAESLKADKTWQSGH